MIKTQARCRCGKVQIELAGVPMASLLCYCNDCQQASAQLAELGSYSPIVDAAGGTPYVIWRKDRLHMPAGQEQLASLRLRENSATARRYARCCGTPMVATFDDARHWVTVYRTCIVSPVPPPEWRIMTRSVADPAGFRDGIPRFRQIPMAMVWRLLSSRIAMAFGR